jgi:hypothetical protein
VTAVDQSNVGLAKAARLAEARGVTVTTEVSDLSEYVIAPDSWAGIVSIFFHVPSKLRQGISARAVAALRPGGVFVLEAYHPRQIGRDTGGPRDPNLMPTLDLLRAELAGLELLIGRELRREVIEGIGHTGEAEVVQVLARKPSTEPVH